MNIVVLCNPVSGAGRSAAAAERLATALRDAGHGVTVAATCREPATRWLDPLLSGADLLVVAGGDGAIRMVCESASRTATPIYHLPMGTENLFAREFKMTRDPATLLRAIERHEIRAVDLGFANGEAFTLMASIGFDAEVVHELAQCRGSSISHWSYVPPIWRQFWRWSPACVDVHIDGEPIASGEPGFLVVANSRQYGWRLDPAARASMTDGLFDIAYFRARSRLDLITWAMKCRMGRHLGHSRLTYRTGQHVTLGCDRPCHYQLDGDPPSCGEKRSAVDEPLRLELTISPEALRVLVPR